MKFQVKALVAALALTATGLANAAAPSTGDGSLFISIFDRTNNTSVYFDTGYFYSTLNEIGTSHADTNFDGANTTLTFDIGANTSFQSFIASADLGNTYYNVFAGDSADVQGAGVRGAISTYDVTDPTKDTFTISKSPLVTLIDQHYNFMLETGGPNNTLAYFASDKNSGRGPKSIGLVGSELSLYQTVQNAGNGAGQNFLYDNTKVTFTQGGLLTISSAVVATTPVPEPESFALMALGFGVISAAARRRKSAK